MTWPSGDPLRQSLPYSLYIPEGVEDQALHLVAEPKVTLLALLPHLYQGRAHYTTPPSTCTTCSTLLLSTTLPSLDFTGLSSST